MKDLARIHQNLVCSAVYILSHILKKLQLFKFLYLNLKKPVRPYVRLKVSFPFVCNCLYFFLEDVARRNNTLLISDVLKQNRAYHVWHVL